MSPHAEPYIAKTQSQDQSLPPQGEPSQSGSDRTSEEELQSTFEGSSLSDVVTAYTSWGTEVLNLAQLEAKLVVRSAMRMLALACSISILLVSAWILGIASLSVWIWQAGVSLPAVLLMTAVVLLCSAFVLWRWFLKTSTHLSFNNTLSQLSSKHTQSSAMDKDA
ncbi:hypothetical protein [Neptunomonas phycophila]|uniref:hypothetical protein n=1 Tax=Neptunomonas TaxID=75687 RepID=UPI0023F8180F|nr:hypothetical protein [Neptunomonas phycophila]MDO6467493.1 hypothetical protein [Neptunomonas phycophila]